MTVNVNQFKIFFGFSRTTHGFIDVARLDRIIDEHDRYVIELGISMGMDPKVEYGPIDQFLPDLA